MRLIILFVLFVCVSSELSVYDYHVKVGVQKAASILQSETSVGRIVGGSQAAAFAYPYQEESFAAMEDVTDENCVSQPQCSLDAGAGGAMELWHRRLGHLSYSGAGIVVTLTTGWTSVCGGSLLSTTRVLTAAHCWWDGQSQARTFTVVLGSLLLFSGGTRRDTTDVVVHSSWNTQDITFDIAMVKIAAVSYDNSIQAIPLPAAADVNRDFAGLTAVASGYGKTTDAQNSFPTTTSLHHVNLQVVTNTVCQHSFDVPIHGSHLCTSGLNGVGTCDGDSGGPLTAVWNNGRILIGVVSFGLGDRCQASYPSVFTRVTAFLNWIQANM